MLPQREPGSDRRLLYAAAFLRAFGVGMTGVLLGLYLARAGLDEARIGVVISLGLAGAALGTLVVSWRGDALGRRRSLIALSLLAGAGGLALALGQGFGVLCLAAFLGMANGMGRDRGPASVLEHAILPATASDAARTGVFVRYNLVLDAGHALGALAAGLPALLQQRLAGLESYRWSLAIPALCGLAAALVYTRLSPAAEAAPQPARARLSPRSRAIVARFAALSTLDSLGGGFLTTSFLTLWFARRYGVGEEALGPLFAAARLANAASHLGAGWLARRIGLVATMVWTHVPSSLLLMALPFVGSFPPAAALFLLRECLVEMDVPTRQSYLMAVVAPQERVTAAGVASLTRGAAWAVAPSLAGVLSRFWSLSAPLFAGPAIKIVYDLLLLSEFRGVRPPEEAERA
ncbi:MAG: MFS transporter [Planctomycetota bacterium]|nr:MAG: MFS transporter [Planctomycetota bacterium]